MNYFDFQNSVGSQNNRLSRSVEKKIKIMFSTETFCSEMKVLFLSLGSAAPVGQRSWHWCPWQYQAVPAAVDGGDLPPRAPAAAAASPAAHCLETVQLYTSRWAFLSRTKADTVAFTKSVSKISCISKNNCVFNSDVCPL